MKQSKLFGYLLLMLLLTLLGYAGFLSYRSIDWDVLKRLESKPLALPSPITTPAPTTTTESKQE